METNHLHYVYKHFRFLGNGAVNLHETEHHTGRHGRAYHWQRGTQQPWQPSGRGGYTICYVYNPDGELVSTGMAHCSKQDHFCYRLGRDIARGRALKSARQAEFDAWIDMVAEAVAA